MQACHCWKYINLFGQFYQLAIFMDSGGDV